MNTDWSFTGRQQELARVTEAVLGGSHPGGIVLAGEAGVGKTRLAQEALSSARRRGAKTQWVAATASAATIPLGALARLLPPLGTGSDTDSLSLLHHAMGALTKSAGNRLLVLGVDDAHLIDDTSATLLHQLVLSGSAVVVVTVRRGHPAPDSVTALWKDDLLDRLDVEPLDRRRTEELLTRALDGAVESATLERLWRLTKGNPLFLREVVEGARRQEQLVVRSGVWRWEGEFSPTPRLAELLRGRLSRLAPAERKLTQALAFGEPLGLGLATELVSAETVRECERRGLVAVERDGRRRQLRLRHPLYGEVIRVEASALEAAESRRALARAQAPHRLRRRGDVLRHATLQLEADGTGDPALLTVAARQATHIDPKRAEEMAQAAVAAGAGFEARLALAAALSCQGRLDDADDVLSQAAAVAANADQRATATLARAPNLFWGQGRIQDAEAMLEAAQGTTASVVVSHRLLAVRAAFSLFGGRPRAAIDLAAKVLVSPEASAATVVAAASPAAQALARCGRTAEALSVNARGRAALAGAEEMAQFRAPLHHSEITALLLAGRLSEATARAKAYHQGIVSQPGSSVKALCGCLLRGQTALMSGRPATALRWLQEAAGSADALDSAAWLYWCQLGIAEALAVAGKAGAARHALEEARAARRPVFALWRPDELLAETWVAAAEGETSRATSLAGEAAGAARGGGQSAVEALALHVAVRLGDAAAVAPRLRALTASVDGGLVTAFSAHADAHASDDAKVLEEVSSHFEALGACLLAAEAAAHAAAAHRRAGRLARASGSASRARALAAACEGARTPALSVASPAPPLTRREREVAGLAARGLTNRAIAERLFVSVRTVGNHLDSAYTKLGVHSRSDLAVALGLDPPPSRPAETE